MANYVIVAGAAIASFFLSRTMAHNQRISQEGPRVGDLNIIGSRYNEAIPIPYGQTRLSGNIVWGIPLRETIVRTKHKQKTGKGGGGGSTTTITTVYVYDGTFTVVLGYGYTDRPMKIWMDKNLVWQHGSTPSYYAGELSGGGSFEFMPGSNHGVVSSLMQTYLGYDNTPGYRNMTCLVLSHVPLAKYGDRLPSVEVELAQNGPGAGTTATQVITDVCSLAGIDPVFLDTTDLSTDIMGLTVGKSTAATTLEDLMNVFQIQCCMSEGKLKFRNIKQPIAATLTEQDLLQQDADLIQVTRIREDDLPRMVSVEYLDKDRAYQQSSQTAIRSLGNSVEQITVASNTVMTASAAIKIADSILHRAWAARYRFSGIQLSRQYLYLDVGDIIQLTVESQQYMIRITSLDFGADFSLKVEGESYDATILEGQGVGDSGQGFPGQGLPVYGDTLVKFIDIPNLEPQQADLFGFYLAADGTGKAWKAAVIDVSLDDGANWAEAGFLSAYSLMGDVYGILPPPPAGIGHHLWDKVSYVDLHCPKGGLQSVTKEQIYAGANAFIIGSEVVQAANISPLGNNMYRLRDFLRGRRGTDIWQGAHVAHETWAMAETVLFIQMQGHHKGVPLRYRVSPVGHDDSTEYEFTSYSNCTAPWTLAFLKGIRDAQGNLKLSWQHRSRKYEELPNMGSQPFDYEGMRFFIQIFVGQDTIRTFDITNIWSVNYSASDIFADFGSIPAQINVRAFQYSPIGGYGFAIERTF